jgi:hypothetical protein
MAIDPYDLCPCYSGKKVKFCCLPVIDEMEKAATQINQKNFRSAVKLCQQAEKKHPGHPWPLILHAFALQQENNLDEAYELMKNSVMDMQDHPGVFAMFTSIHLKKMGYKDSKKLVDRALQLALKHPEPMHVLPLIYNPLSMVINEDEHLLSARYFLSVDISSCTPEIQKHLMQELYNLDSYAEYAINMRGPQFLKSWQSPEEESQQLFDRFMQTAGYGMLERAQAMLQRLIDKYPQDAILFWNLGLIQAWDQREEEACESLRKSASLFADEHAAIEAYALMVAITWYSQASAGSRFIKVYKVTAHSKLLSALDQASRFRKSQDLQNNDNVDVSLYMGIDREFNAENLPADAHWRDYPAYLGQLHIVNEKTNQHKEEIQCWLLAEDQDCLDQLDQQLQLVASDTLTTSEITDEEKNRLPLNNKRFVPDLKELWSRRAIGLGISGNADNQLVIDEMEDRITQQWINQPLEILHGKSLMEAATIPSLFRLCHAVLFVAEVTIVIKPEVLDKVYQLVGFNRLPKMKLEQLSDPTHVSNYQLYHLDFTGLEHSTLYLINERVHILQDVTTTIRVLEELYNNGQVNQEEKLAICIELARNYFRYLLLENATEWISQAELRLKDLETDMESKLKLEFSILSYHFSALDPQIQQRIKDFRTKYEIKFPEIKETLRGMALKAAQKMGQVVPAETTNNSASGLWTPDQSVPAATSSGGLWIPGS